MPLVGESASPFFFVFVKWVFLLLRVGVGSAALKNARFVLIKNFLGPLCVKGFISRLHSFLQFVIIIIQVTPTGVVFIGTYALKGF